jgi:hypothetical protein
LWKIKHENWTHFFSATDIWLDKMFSALTLIKTCSFWVQWVNYASTCFNFEKGTVICSEILHLCTYQLWRKVATYFFQLGSSVSVTTRYGWTVRRSNSDVEEIFRTRPYRRWGTPSLCFTTGHFPGVKRSGRGVNYPPPSSAKFKDSVEEYVYPPPPGPSWPVPHWNWGRTLLSSLHSNISLNLILAAHLLRHLFS